jgi:splicing factor 3A subunit 2
MCNHFPSHTLLSECQVAAEPYETIAFRIPAREIEEEADDAGYWNWSYWDPDTKQYSFQFMYRLTY